MTAPDMRHPRPAADVLRDEFRQHLQRFYSGLKLAPPYDSIEKALRRLTESISALPPPDQHRLLSDQTLQWVQFRQAFIDSGLSQKHRGIICGLAKDRSRLELPAEYDHLLSVYTGGT